MRIIGVQSLAPGSQQLAEAQVDSFVNIDDDLSDESGVEIIDSPGVDADPQEMLLAGVVDPTEENINISTESANCRNDMTFTEADADPSSKHVEVIGLMEMEAQKNPVVINVGKSSDSPAVVSIGESPESPAVVSNEESPESPADVSIEESPESPAVLPESPESPPLIIPGRSLNPTVKIGYADVKREDTDTKMNFSSGKEVIPDPETPERKENLNYMAMSFESEMKDSPDSPEVIVLDSPASPLPTTDELSLGHSMKVRIEESIDCPSNAGSVCFALDNQGETPEDSGDNETDSRDKTIIKSASTSEPTSSSIEADSSSGRKHRQKGRKRKRIVANPLYSRETQHVLGHGTNNQKASIDSEICTPPNKRRCFNCLGDHVLKDCPQPRSQAMIQQRLNEFKSKATDKAQRYHHVPFSKYDYCKPGQISDTLRIALGVCRNELPRHTWMMRKYGYPPGWFAEAVEAVEPPNLTFDGIATVRKSTEFDMLKMFKEKLIEYPGFTTPVPEGCLDDGDYVFGIPFNEKQTVENLACEWNHINNRKKLTAKRKTAVVLPRSSASGNADSADQRQMSQSSRITPGSSLGCTQQERGTNAQANESSWFDELLHRPSRLRNKKIKSNTAADVQRPSESKWQLYEFDRSLVLAELKGYRLTMAREQVEAERQKQLEASQRAAERPFRERESPKSPSLLENWDQQNKYFFPNGNCSQVKSSEEDEEDEDDDDCMIIEDLVPIAPYDPDHIEVDKDYDGPNKVTLVPNPVYKMRKIMQKNEEHKVAVPSQPVPVSCSSKDLPALSIQEKKLKISSTFSICEESKKSVTSGECLNVLLKHCDDVNDQSSYVEVPPLGNFSKGMPEMELQETTTERSGRLDRVLTLLPRKLSKRSLKTESDDDEDVMIIDD